MNAMVTAYFVGAAIGSVGAYVVVQVMVSLVSRALRKPEDKIELWRLEREYRRARRNVRH